jgi:hypothetical protein
MDMCRSICPASGILSYCQQVTSGAAAFDWRKDCQEVHEITFLIQEQKVHLVSADSPQTMHGYVISGHEPLLLDSCRVAYQVLFFETS